MRQVRHHSKVKVIFPHQASQPRKRYPTSRNTFAGSRTRIRRRNGIVMEPILLPTGSPVAIPGHPGVPSLFTEPPPIRDELVTETSDQQDDTVEECLPLLAGATPDKTEFDYTPAGIPRLERVDHVDFLRDNLENAKYIPYDAARPWVVYWCLTGLSLLAHDVTQYRQRVVETFTAAQNASGGFGGGHGHLSHLAPSYAAVLSLAMVGGLEAFDLIDRRALWKWLGRVKQPDGGFKMCEGGEEDVRGAYCALVMIALLSLPLELSSDAPARAVGLTNLVDGLPEYLSRCQTFEGGISGSPQTEAHGAYAFCGLASLCILGSPREMLAKHLDTSSLVSWLSSRQHAPEGGFSGRTNKLVDGCYSHWVGGCWPLVEAALEPITSSDAGPDLRPGEMFNREGLIRYILSCCQGPLGGLRDKPSTRPDAYHSCYTLAGLSLTQHRNQYVGGSHGEASGTLDSAFQWTTTPRDAGEVDQDGTMCDEQDSLVAIHPIFVIPWKAVEEARSYFGAKAGF